MATERKTTRLIMDHIPRDISLLAESYIMADQQGMENVRDVFGDQAYAHTLLSLNVSSGHMESAFDSMDQEDLNVSTHAACRYGEMGVIYSLIKLGAKDFTSFARAAIEFDQFECLDYMISKGANLNVCLNHSVGLKKLEAAKYIISRGATNFNVLFTGVGNFDFVSLGFSLGVIPNTSDMNIAGKFGSLGEIVLFHSFGLKYLYAAAGAAISGRLGILKTLVKRDPEIVLNVDRIFSQACFCFYKNQNLHDTIKYLISLGALECNCGAPVSAHLMPDYLRM